MIMDNVFSENQAITVDTASANYVDLQNTKNRVGDPLEIPIAVTTAMAGGTSIIFKAQSDSDSGFATNLVDEATSKSYALADLGLGSIIVLRIPKVTQRYLRLYYDVTGTFTGGAVTAGMVADMQTNGYDAIAEQKAAGVI